VLIARHATTSISISLVAAIYNTCGTILLLIPMLDTTHTHTQDNLKELIWYTVLAVYRQELQTISNDMFTKGQSC
jgi:hypothetical protein